MKNVVIIGISPLVKRRIEVFYIEELIARGFHVLHCDLSPCYWEGLRIENVLYTDYALTFISLSAFENYLNKVDVVNSVFIVEVPHQMQFEPIFRLMKKYKCLCVKINPNASDFTNYRLPFSKMVKSFGLKEALLYQTIPFKSYCKNILLGDLFNIYSLYISSGHDSKIDVHINQPDWEKALYFSSTVATIDYRYAVFCDEYYPLHPDFEYMGGISNVNEIETRYRIELIEFFEYLENKYNVQVVVAAHPKSNYEGHEFGGREIIRGKTMELVKNAAFSIIHGSMSISFSIIFNTPVILTVTDDMLALFYYKRQSAIYSDYFELPICNISKKKEANPEFVNVQVRNRYIYDFLTSPGIENKKNADILAEVFSKI